MAINLRLCIVTIALLIWGCSNSRNQPHEGSIITIDDNGRTVALPSPARRVITVIPSITETIVALGATDAIVARTRYDRQAALRDLPSIGGTLEPSLEAIVALQPDLVILNLDARGVRMGSHLTSMGLTVYHANTDRLSDTDRHMTNLGYLLGRAAEAQALRHQIRQRLLDVTHAVAGNDRPTVLYLVWHEPPQTTGSGTYLDSLITLAGGDNAFSDAPGPWPQLGMEDLLQRDPEALVVAVGNVADESQTAWLRGTAWRELSAVRNGRVLVVSADLFNRPGPHVADAAEQLSRFLHPDAFAER